MRLYDRALKYGVYVPDAWKSHMAEVASSVTRAIPASVVVLADDVARQFADGGNIAHWNSARTILPPYSHLFIEANLPRSGKTLEGAMFSAFRGGQIAAVTETFDLEDYDDPTQEIRSAILGNARQGHSVVRPLRWIVDQYVFLRVGGRPAHEPLSGPFFFTKFAIDVDGHLGRLTSGDPISRLLPMPGYPSPEDVMELAKIFAPFINHPIHLMNCKNIDLMDAPFSRNTRRERRRQQLPDVKYKVLTISPSMTPGSRSEGGLTLDTMPLHLVRGSFATYTEDKPLFGKYTGTFWRPAHVRGTADAGTVYKDYKVKAGGTA